MLIAAILVVIALLVFIAISAFQAKDRLARIESYTSELVYRFDPQARWRQCRESEERGKMIRELMTDLRLAKGDEFAQARASKMASQMNGNEIRQACGEKPLNICSCGKIFADSDALDWHRVRTRHSSWAEMAVCPPDPDGQFGAEPYALPPELGKAGISIGAKVRFESEVFPGTFGVLEKVAQMPNGLTVGLVRTSLGEVELVETSKIRKD